MSSCTVILAVLAFCALTSLPSLSQARGYPFCDALISEGTSEGTTYCGCPPGCHLTGYCNISINFTDVCERCPPNTFQPITDIVWNCIPCEGKLRGRGCGCNATHAPVTCPTTPPPPTTSVTHPPPTSSPSSSPPTVAPAAATSVTSTASTAPATQHLNNASTTAVPLTIHHSPSPAVIGAGCAAVAVVLLTVAIVLSRLVSRWRRRQRLADFCRKSLADFLHHCRRVPAMRTRNASVWKLMNRRDDDRMLLRWTSSARCPVHSDRQLDHVTHHVGFKRRCSCIINSSMLTGRGRTGDGQVRYLEDLTVIEAMLLSMHLDVATETSERPWQTVAEIYSDDNISVGIIHEISIRGGIPPPKSTGSPTFELLLLLASLPRRFSVAKLGHELCSRGYQEAACCLDYREEDVVTLLSTVATADNGSGASGNSVEGCTRCSDSLNGQTRPSPPDISTLPSPPSHWRPQYTEDEEDSEDDDPRRSRWGKLSAFGLRDPLSRQFWRMSRARFQPGKGGLSRSGSGQSRGSQTILLVETSPEASDDESEASGTAAHSNAVRRTSHPGELSRQYSMPQPIADQNDVRQALQNMVLVGVSSYGDSDDQPTFARQPAQPSPGAGTSLIGAAAPSSGRQQPWRSRTSLSSTDSTPPPLSVSDHGQHTQQHRPARRQSSSRANGLASPVVASNRTTRHALDPSPVGSFPRAPRPGDDHGFHSPPTDSQTALQDLYPVMLRPDQVLGQEAVAAIQSKQQRHRGESHLIQPSMLDIDDWDEPEKPLVTAAMEMVRPDDQRRATGNRLPGPGGRYAPNNGGLPPALQPRWQRKPGEDALPAEYIPRGPNSPVPGSWRTRKTPQDMAEEAGRGDEAPAQAHHHRRGPSTTRNHDSVDSSTCEGVQWPCSPPSAASLRTAVAGKSPGRSSNSNTGRPAAARGLQKPRHQVRTKSETSSSSERSGTRDAASRSGKPANEGTLPGRQGRGWSGGLPGGRLTESTGAHGGSQDGDDDDETAAVAEPAERCPLDKSGNLVTDLVRRSMQEREEVERNGELGHG